MDEFLAIGDVTVFVLAWGAASTIVDGGDADYKIVKLFLEENGAILIVFVPLVDHLFESFSLRCLGEALELVFYPVHEEEVIGAETDFGDLMIIIQEVGDVWADAVRPNWLLMVFVDRILSVLGIGFDGLGCDGLDDGVDSDVPDLEALANAVEQVCFPQVLWEDAS